MPHLMELKPKDLPKGFDIKRQGEKPVVKFDFKDNIIKVSFAFPGFTISHKTRKSRAKVLPKPSSFVHEVGISGTGFFSENGKPLLPAFGRFVQIPPGYKFDVGWEKSNPREFKNVKLKPAQENALDQQAWKYEFDKVAYRDNNFFPDKIVDCNGPLYLDAYSVICLHVTPMQYNPSRQLLRCFSNITVHITLAPEKSLTRRDASGQKIDPWVFMDRSKNLEGYGNFVFNPGRTYFDRKVKLPSLTDTEEKPEKAEFLILYGKDFEKSALRLKAWKTKRGLETKTVCVDTVFKPEEEKTTKINKLKQYIRKLRRTPFSHLRYVLLFGDVDEIPTEQINRTTTDHYFFTHRDALNDSECLLPWIAGGRIPARSKSEGLSVVNQIIRYEKNPPDAPKYYERMTVAAYFEDCGDEGQQDGRADKAFLKTMESIRTHLISQKYHVNRVYVKNYDEPAFYSDGSPVPEEVKEVMISKKQGQRATRKLIRFINRGQLIVGHRGHGEKWGWDNPPLKNDDLEKITSQIPSIFFSINCLTGSFDWKKDCFAEHILALNGGAPSLIASTEFSGTWRNDSMIKALYDAIWPGVLHTFPATTIKYPIKYCRMGDVLNYAKAYLLVAHGFNQNTRKHFEIYHVIGDPTLQIWGDKPVALELRTYLVKDVLLINMNTCPRDSVLSVWYDGKRLIRLRPSVTHVAIPLMRFKELPEDALQPARDKTYALSVCLAAPGHRIAESSVRF